MRLSNRLAVFVAVGIAGLLRPSPALATSFDISLDPGLFGNLNQHDVNGCAGDPGGEIACGPTAATNGLAFLQEMYSGTYDHWLIPDTNHNGSIDYNELQSVANVLATNTFMNCSVCTPGTYADDFIFGMETFMEALAPERTMYAAQDPFAWNRTPTRPAYVQPVTPTFGFLFNELEAGQAVEILINGAFNHYLTLTGLRWSDTNNDGIIDDSEFAVMLYVDPATGIFGGAPIFTDGAQIGTRYGGVGVGVSDITVAVAEGEVPEPTTSLLLGTGLVALLRVRRRRK